MYNCTKWGLAFVGHFQKVKISDSLRDRYHANVIYTTTNEGRKRFEFLFFKSSLRKFRNCHRRRAVTPTAIIIKAKNAGSLTSMKWIVLSLFVILIFEIHEIL